MDEIQICVVDLRKATCLWQSKVILSNEITELDERTPLTAAPLKTQSKCRVFGRIYIMPGCVGRNDSPRPSARDVCVPVAADAQG